MADGLQMGNLSINESQHAPQGNAPAQGRSAYIPPHLRQRGGPASSTPVDGPAPGGDFGGPRYSFQMKCTSSVH
jgi:ATP-dependent RNA helicase DDX3X